jgi:S-formylglutathione hydrolase FrmB
MIKAKLLLILLFFSLLKISVAGSFEKKQFFSPALNRNETYFVSLPTGYNEADTTKKFPVIIFLHGASIDAEEAATQLQNFLNNPLTSTFLQNIYKAIFIIPNGNTGPYLGSFYSNSQLYGNYEDYIENDLIREIRSNYHTFNIREKWSVMGHSMGGYGAMKIAMKHPELFIGVASLSGPLHTTWYNDILPFVLAEHGNTPPYNFTYEGDITKLIYTMAGAFSPDTTLNPPVLFPILNDGTINEEILPLWNKENPANLVADLNGNFPLAIFTYCGKLDEYKIFSQNQLFSDSLDHYGIPHSFYVDPSGNHILSLVTSFPKGLNFLVSVMDTAGSKYSSIDQKNISSQFIYPNPVKDLITLPASSTNKILKVSVLSSSGKVLIIFNSIDNQHSITVQNLMPGLYLLRINYSDKQTSEFRFIKTN